MNRATVAFGGLVLLSILACTGGTTTPAEPTPTTTTPPATTTTPAPAATTASTLPAPWNVMNLPVGTGEVVDASVESVLVAYDVASLTTLTTDWTNAMLANGYTKAEDVSKPGLTAIVFARGSQLVGLATGQEEGVNFAYVEDLGMVKTSVVRGSGKTGVKGRRGGGRGGAGGPRGDGTGPRGAH